MKSSKSGKSGESGKAVDPSHQFRPIFFPYRYTDFDIFFILLQQYNCK